MKKMRRNARVLAILLSMALMLTMVLPVAFAEDNVQAADTETLQDGSTGASEELTDGSAQAADETAEEAVQNETAAEEVTEESQGDIATEETALDEEGDEEAQPEEEPEPDIVDNPEAAVDLAILVSTARLRRTLKLRASQNQYLLPVWMQATAQMSSSYSASTRQSMRAGCSVSHARHTCSSTMIRNIMSMARSETSRSAIRRASSETWLCLQRR